MSNISKGLARFANAEWRRMFCTGAAGTPHVGMPWSWGALGSCVRSPA